jgi:hypothetical protein
MSFSPSLEDCGDYVVVINARHIATNSNVPKHKVYRHHTRHPGGLKEISFREMMEKNPDEVCFGFLPFSSSSSINCPDELFSLLYFKYLYLFSYLFL